MKKYKVAILYYGIHPNYCFNECFLQLKKKLIDQNTNYDFDIFIHRWIFDKKILDWLPPISTKNKRLSKKEFKIDYKFLDNVVKPKKIKYDVCIDFTQKKYEKNIGPSYYFSLKSKHKDFFTSKVHQPKCISSDITKKNLIYNSISKFYSMYSVNKLRLEYEKENDIIYDKIISIESDLFIFSNINLDNYSGFCIGSRDFTRKLPKNSKISNNFFHKYLCNLLIIGDNNKDIKNYFNTFFDYYKIYKNYPYSICNFKKWSYYQHEYISYLATKYYNINFTFIEDILFGRFRKDGVKINFACGCLKDKINYVNVRSRFFPEAYNRPHDARKYIPKNL